MLWRHPSNCIQRLQLGHDKSLMGTAQANRSTPFLHLWTGMKRHHPPRADLDRLSGPWVPPGTCTFLAQNEVPEAGQSDIFPGGQRCADLVKERIDQRLTCLYGQTGGVRQRIGYFQFCDGHIRRPGGGRQRRHHEGALWGGRGTRETGSLRQIHRSRGSCPTFALPDLAFPHKPCAIQGRLHSRHWRRRAGMPDHSSWTGCLVLYSTFPIPCASYQRTSA